MKQKYIIRETSVPFDPPYTPLYFHAFTRSAGICMVFGHKLAAEYDTLEAANKTLVKVKELSGRDTWDVEPKFKIKHPYVGLPDWPSKCEFCGILFEEHP